MQLKNKDILSLCTVCLCMDSIYSYSVCVLMYVCITVQNCFLSFTDSILIMSVTPCLLYCWIIDAGSTVRIRDSAMIDECFMLPFILYMIVGGISMAVCYCFQQQWHSVNVLRMFHVHTLNHHSHLLPLLHIFITLIYTCVSFDRCFLQLR